MIPDPAKYFRSVKLNHRYSRGQYEAEIWKKKGEDERKMRKKKGRKTAGK
jgi:hypothetical protein